MMTALKKLFMRLMRNDRGVAASEFALIAPVMILIFMGVVEISSLTNVDKKVIKVSHSITDLVSQERVVTDQDMTNIFRAAELIMAPHPVSRLRIGVASVRYDENDAPYVDWEDSYNGGSVGTAENSAAGLGAFGDSVIVVSVEYTYDPVITGPIDFTGVILDETGVQRPRRTAFIVRN